MKEVILKVLNEWDLSCSEEPELKSEIAEQIINALKIAPKYNLFSGSTYVERTGESDQEVHQGTFYSLQEMNDHIQNDDWFMGFDMRGKLFTEEIKRFEQKEKNGWSYCYVYYERSK